MTLFLTSDPGGYDRFRGVPDPRGLNPQNGLVTELKARWPQEARVLLISAFPDGFDGNDQNREILKNALIRSGLPVARMDVWDRRVAGYALEDYDLLILGGGHVPTQNRYFGEIGLKEALANYDGMVLGISAGTMNCAETVYAQPELEGEALDPDYQRFIPGLGLTDIMVLPHYQLLREEVLDGLRVIEDITLGDSMGNRFYLLVDGSYILVEQGLRRIYGESYLVENGTIQPLCGLGETVEI